MRDIPSLIADSERAAARGSGFETLAALALSHPCAPESASGTMPRPRRRAYPPGMTDVTLQQKSDKVAHQMRAQIPAGIVFFFLVTFVAALPFALFDATRPLAWPAGIVIGALATWGLISLRLAQLRKNAGMGSLRITDQGLVAEYGRTTRTLAWGDIRELGRVAYPASPLAKSGSIAGAVVAVTVTQAGKAVAPKYDGVLGPGTWDETGGTLQGVKLRREAMLLHGGDPATRRPLVPIWFRDYEDDWRTGQIGQAIARFRPDLLAGYPVSGQQGDQAQGQG